MESDIKEKVRTKQKDFRQISWHSIFVRLILVVVGLILPMNIVMIFIARSYIRSLEEQALQSITGIVNLNLNSLKAVQSQLNKYAYEQQFSNSMYDDFVNPANKNMFQIACIGLNRTALEELPTGGAFFYQKDRDILIIALRESTVKVRSQLDKELRQKDLLQQQMGWKKIAAGDEIFLYRVSRFYNTGIGLLISLNDFMDQVQQQTGYSNCRVSISKKAIEGKKGTLFYSARIPNSNYRINAVIDIAEVRDKVPPLHIIIYYLAIFFLAAIPVLLLCTWKLVIKPLRRIDHALIHLENGEQDYRIRDFRASSEFEEVAGSFNRMADTIHDLKIASYEKKLNEERMRIQNLLLQTRPHFMLNEFNMIFSMAQLKNFEGVQRMAVYLANYFRYFYNGDELRTIQKEMELIRYYVDTMELQYPDCFEVNYDLDESLMGTKVPPLLIHNFVENIFKYAVGDGMDTKINISLHKRRDMICLMLQDDGPGMDEKILTSIREGKPIRKADGKHIGIWNSVYRLKTLCGDNAELLVTSALSQGTTIEIMLPYQEKKTLQKIITETYGGDSNDQ